MQLVDMINALLNCRSLYFERFADGENFDFLSHSFYFLREYVRVGFGGALGTQTSCAKHFSVRFWEEADAEKEEACHSEYSHRPEEAGS